MEESKRAIFLDKNTIKVNSPKKFRIKEPLMKRTLIILLAAISIATSCEQSSSDSPQPSVFTLNRSTLNLLVGNSFQLIPSENNITWESDDDSIAEVTNEGTVTGIGEGQTIITATTGDNEDSATCTVTVTKESVAVTGVTLNMTNAEITVDGTIDLDETINPSNATNPAVTWSSSTTAATVDQNGVVTGIRQGSTEITVTTVDGSKKAKCTITIRAKPVPVTGITINKTTANAYPDIELQLSYTIAPSNATNKNVTWASSDTNVADVTSTGIVTGKKAGQADITVTTADGSFIGTCIVTVDTNIVCTTGTFRRSLMYDYPCFWINQTIYELPVPSGFYGAALEVISGDGNIYILGRYWDFMKQTQRDCYWKNKVLYTLSKPAGSGVEFVMDIIKVLNGKLYLGGTYFYNNKRCGAYWIDNIRYDLPMPEGYEFNTVYKFDMFEDGTVLTYAGLYNPTDGKTKLAYWLNQEYHELPIPDGAISPYFNPYSKSHTIVGNDLYLTAFHGYSGSYQYPLNWVNGVSYNLDPAEALSISYSSHVVSDGKLYFYGTYTIEDELGFPNDPLPCYWVDTARIDLPIPLPNLYSGYAEDLMVSEDTVYTIGVYKNNSGYTHCYWVNNTRYDLGLTESNNTLKLYKKFLYDDIVWFAYQNRASYWTNTTENVLPLPDGNQGFTELSFMELQNGNMYIVGYYKNAAGKYTYSYWINTERFDFDSSAQIDNLDIFVSDSNIYNLGSILDGTVRKSCYWINTTPYILEKVKSDDGITTGYIIRTK